MAKSRLNNRRANAIAQINARQVAFNRIPNSGEDIKLENLKLRFSALASETRLIAAQQCVQVRQYFQTEMG